MHDSWRDWKARLFQWKSSLSCLSWPSVRTWGWQVDGSHKIFSQCLTYCRSALSTPCGHLICSVCLPKALEANGRCPKCRKKVLIKDAIKIHVWKTAECWISSSHNKTAFTEITAAQCLLCILACWNRFQDNLSQQYHLIISSLSGKKPKQKHHNIA